MNSRKVVPIDSLEPVCPATTTGSPVLTPSRKLKAQSNWGVALKALKQKIENEKKEKKKRGDSVEDFISKLSKSDTFSAEDGTESSSLPSMIICEDSPSLMWWNLFVICFILYYTVCVPLRIVFSSNYPENDFLSALGVFLIIDLSADLLFIFDIIISFRTAPKVHGKYITGGWRIAARYATTWLAVDLLASIPTSFIFLFSDGDASSSTAGILSQGGRLGKLLRLLRVFKLFRVFRLSRVMRQVKSYTTINPATVSFARILLGLGLVWHVIACLYWGISTLEGFCGWGPPLDADGAIGDAEAAAQNLNYYVWGAAEEVGNGPNGFIECTVSWSPWEQLLNETFATAYLQCFFWSIVVTTGVGKDIIPQTNVETGFTVAIVICGVFMLAVIIGSLTNIIQHKDVTKEIWARKLDGISAFMRYHRVSLPLQTSIREFYEYMRSRQQQLDSEIFEDLNPALQMRLKVALSWRPFNRIPLFRGSPPEIMMSLLRRLESTISVPGEYIISQGQIGAEMFILRHGSAKEVVLVAEKSHRLGDGIEEVKVDEWSSEEEEEKRKPRRKTLKDASDRWSSKRTVGPKRTNSWMDVFTKMKHRDQEKTVQILAPNQFFGENALLGEPHSSSIYAVTYCDLWLIRASDVADVCDEFPELAGRIEAEAAARNVHLNDTVGVSTSSDGGRRLSSQTSFSSKLKRLSPPPEVVVKEAVRGPLGAVNEQHEEEEEEWKASAPFKASAPSFRGKFFSTTSAGSSRRQSEPRRSSYHPMGRILGSVQGDSSASVVQQLETISDVVNGLLSRMRGPDRPKLTSAAVSAPKPRGLSRHSSFGMMRQMHSEA